VRHDSSSFFALTTNTWHSYVIYNTKFVQKLAFTFRNCLFSLETIKHFKHTSKVSCDLVLKIFINVLLMTVNRLILILAQMTGLQSVEQDWETFRFYKLYNTLIRGNSTNTSKNTIE